MEKLLEGVRVLDLGRYIACPYCGLLLAGMGAEVIRLERPGGEPELVLPFNFESWDYFSMVYGVNKRGITLNLMHEKGREIFKELVRRCDVVLENFSVDAAKAIGLEYEALKEVNPRIIFVA
ncbi:MAG: CoA transferase, partial [Dehalococcoidia bacterium]